MALLTETLRKSLTPELYSQVEEALGDDFDMDLVPRSRLNKVIAQRNEARAQLATPTQGAAQAPTGMDPDDDLGGGMGAAKAKAKPGGATNIDEAALRTQFEEEKQREINALKVQFAALGKLRDSKARDADLVYGLLDSAKLSIDEKGGLLGLDDQLKALQESKGFLFDNESEGVATGTGKAGGKGKGGSVDAVDAQIDSVFASFGVKPATTE